MAIQAFKYLKSPNVVLHRAVLVRALLAIPTPGDMQAYTEAKRCAHIIFYTLIKVRDRNLQRGVARKVYRVAATRSVSLFLC
jgi:hypothetical protein